MTPEGDNNTDESMEVWRQAILAESSTIEQVIVNLDQVGIRIVLVVDKSHKLLGTISDGDIRRGLLKGMDLNSPIAGLVNQNALVVPPEMSRDMGV